VRPSGVVEPGKEAIVPGTLVSPIEGGVTNWPSPAYSPDTGLFYTQERNQFNLLYLTDPDPRGALGNSGKTTATIGTTGDYLTAIDPKTGRVAWRHPVSGGNVGGLLATAGGLLFSSNGADSLVAWDATNGDALWGARIGNVSNAPQTFTLDGKQMVLVAVQDVLYAFRLN
jgi:alcohol dehydrogenase (cytochrome c)